MSFLLDTNICSFHLRRPSGLVHRFVQHSGRLYIPTIVLGELYAWAYCRPDPDPALNAIHEMLRLEVQVVDLDSVCAQEFGRLRGILRPMGITVPPVDLMIGAVALVNDLTLVTNNTADFCRIPDLQLEDWISP